MKLKKHDKEDWLPRKLFNKIRTGGDAMEIIKKFYDQSLKFPIEARNGFNEILRSSSCITVREEERLPLSLKIICSDIDHDKLIGLNISYKCLNPPANRRVIFDIDLTVEVAYLFISCFDLNPYYQQSGFGSNDNVVLNLRKYHDRFSGIKGFDRAFNLARARSYRRIHIQSILPIVKDVTSVINLNTTSVQGDNMNATNEQAIETQSETSSSQVELETGLQPQPEVEQEINSQTDSPESVVEQPQVPVIVHYELVKDTINSIAVKSRDNFGIEFTAQMYAYIFVADKPKDLSVDQALKCLDELTARQLFELSEILNFDNCIAATTDNWLADFCTHLVESTGMRTSLKSTVNDKTEFERILAQLSSISHRLSNLEYQNHRSGLEIQGASSDDRFGRSRSHPRDRPLVNKL